MGQCGSKQDYEPQYSSRPHYKQGYGGPKYDQYAQERYQREQWERQQKKKKRSRMNGIVAAAAAGAS